MKLADRRGPDKSFYASEVARSVDPDNWKNLMDQVRFVADVLVREGKIKPMVNTDRQQKAQESSESAEFIKS